MVKCTAAIFLGTFFFVIILVSLNKFDLKFYQGWQDRDCASVYISFMCLRQSNVGPKCFGKNHGIYSSTNSTFLSCFNKTIHDRDNKLRLIKINKDK